MFQRLPKGEEIKMNIYEKLSKIQVELKAPKNQRNNFGGYNFRSCEDILESVKPLLEKYQTALTIGDEICLIGDRYYIKATATIYDAENEKSEVKVSAFAREGDNQKGMSEAQLTGSTSSYARKYALNGLFSIDDTKDPDATNTHGKANISKSDSKALKIDSTVSEGQNNYTITDKQFKRLLAISAKAGYNKEQLDNMVKKRYNKKSNELTKTEYDYIISKLEGK